MKESIEYYYNIEIDELNDEANRYSFFYHNNIYVFVKYNRNINELDNIIECSKEMKQKNIIVMDIILNKNYQALTKIDDENYLLLKTMNNYKQTIDLMEMIEINKRTFLNANSLKLYNNNWGSLWSKKLDYFEYQIRELGKNKEIILDSFSYYLGMGENAIALVNNANKKYLSTGMGKICLCHRRIFYPNYEINYGNPLSFIFDLDIRDIAEYLKSCFFANDNAYLELVTFLKMRSLSNYEAQMFMARLIYPSYYFDIYEDVMNNNRKEDDLIKIIKKVGEYESFLKLTYNEILKYNNIDKINWLINQHNS